jgi:hypothetical protein
MAELPMHQPTAQGCDATMMLQKTIAGHPKKSLLLIADWLFTFSL